MIDDQEFTRELVTTIFRRANAEVHAASSVREGLKLFEAVIPDVVVSDLAMPVEDGYAFVKAVRAMSDGDRSRTPIIALTAFGRPEDRRRALASGFDDYLKKPVDPHELASTVLRFTRRNTQ